VVLKEMELFCEYVRNSFTANLFKSVFCSQTVGDLVVADKFPPRQI